MSLLKTRLEKYLKEKAEAYQERLHSNQIGNIEEYRNITGRLQSLYGMAQELEDVYARIVNNAEED